MKFKELKNTKMLKLFILLSSGILLNSTLNNFPANKNDFGVVKVSAMEDPNPQPKPIVVNQKPKAPDGLELYNDFSLKGYGGFTYDNDTKTYKYVQLTKDPDNKGWPLYEDKSLKVDDLPTADERFAAHVIFNFIDWSENRNVTNVGRFSLFAGENYFISDENLKKTMSSSPQVVPMAFGMSSDTKVYQYVRDLRDYVSYGLYKIIYYFGPKIGLNKQITSYADKKSSQSPYIHCKPGLKHTPTKGDICIGMKEANLLNLIKTPKYNDLRQSDASFRSAVDIFLTNKTRIEEILKQDVLEEMLKCIDDNTCEGKDVLKYPDGYTGDADEKDVNKSGIKTKERLKAVITDIVEKGQAIFPYISKYISEVDDSQKEYTTYVQDIKKMIDKFYSENFDPVAAEVDTYLRELNLDKYKEQHAGSPNIVAELDKKPVYIEEELYKKIVAAYMKLKEEINKYIKEKNLDKSVFCGNAVDFSSSKSLETVNLIYKDKTKLGMLGQAFTIIKNDEGNFGVDVNKIKDTFDMNTDVYKNLLANSKTLGFFDIFFLSDISGENQLKGKINISNEMLPKMYNAASAPAKAIYDVFGTQKFEDSTYKPNLNPEVYSGFAIWTKFAELVFKLAGGLIKVQYDCLKNLIDKAYELDNFGKIDPKNLEGVTKCFKELKGLLKIFFTTIGEGQLNVLKNATIFYDTGEEETEEGINGIDKSNYYPKLLSDINNDSSFVEHFGNEYKRYITENEGKLNSDTGAFEFKNPHSSVSDYLIVPLEIVDQFVDLTWDKNEKEYKTQYAEYPQETPLEDIPEKHKDAYGYYLRRGMMTRGDYKNSLRAFAMLKQKYVDLFENNQVLLEALINENSGLGSFLDAKADDSKIETFFGLLKDCFDEVKNRDINTYCADLKKAAVKEGSADNSDKILGESSRVSSQLENLLMGVESISYDIKQIPEEFESDPKIFDLDDEKYVEPAKALHAQLDVDPVIKYIKESLNIGASEVARIIKQGNGVFNKAVKAKASKLKADTMFSGEYGKGNINKTKKPKKTIVKKTG